MKIILEEKGKLLYLFSLTALLSFFFSIYFLAGLNEDLLSSNFPRAVVSFLLNHLLYILMSYFVWYFNKFELEKQKRLQLENEKLQSEMMLLKSQISPHFLFNALNNIYTLTLLKNDDAPKMLSSLSDLLRYFLYEGNKQYVFLESEIEIIEKYIQIQKYRQIPGMNNISLTVSHTTPGIKVPPLLFMTLIENAFKHGNITEDKEGFVHIAFNNSGNRIVFTIINSFHPREKGNGIGLKNVQSQLEIIYGKDYVLNITDENFIFKIELHLNGN